jgi:hypothetical protein
MSPALTETLPGENGRPNEQQQDSWSDPNQQEDA